MRCNYKITFYERLTIIGLYILVLTGLFVTLHCVRYAVINIEQAISNEIENEPSKN